MPDRKFRLLHLSDLHERGPRETEPERRDLVLGDAWKRNLDEVLRDGAIDLVCFTGDLAYSGQPDEYGRVSEFVADLLMRLQLPRERFFAVSGNHDIQRAEAQAVWRRLRARLPRIDGLTLSRWLAGGQPPHGVRPNDLAALLARQAAFRGWLGAADRRPDLLPAPALHPHLGYRHTLRLPHLPFDVQIIGLDSSWMCGANDDAGHLWLTDGQILRLTSDGNGQPLPGFRLVLIHHPLTDLADGVGARRLLAQRTDLLLRGHLHVPDPQIWANPGARHLHEAPTGCLYEDRADRYPNSCQVVTVTCDEAGRPRRFDLWFRGWSTHGHWQSDNSLFEGTVDGRLAWWIEPPPPPLARAPALAMARPFVGRTEQLAALAQPLLGEPPLPPVSVQGMAGSGKTTLIERFAALHAQRFPGGYRRLVLDPLAPLPSVSDLLGRLADELGLSSGADGPAARVGGTLLAARSLLHLDNVDSPAAGRLAAKLALELAGAPLVVSGRLAGLGRSAGWPQIELLRFDEPTALGLLAAELDLDAPLEAHLPLVRALGGLPLALHLAAGHLRAGSSPEGFLALLHARGLSLALPDPADPLHEEHERALLDRTFSLSLDLLEAELGAAAPFVTAFGALGHAPASGFGRSLGAALAGLDPGAFEHLAVTARGLSLLEPLPRTSIREGWRMHPLLVELLRTRGASGLARVVLDRTTAWFTARLSIHGQAQDQGARRRTVQAETEALTEWLPRVPAEDLVRVERAGFWYAVTSGPFHAWLTLCERALAQLSDDVEHHQPWTPDPITRTYPDRTTAVDHEVQELEPRRKGTEEDPVAGSPVTDALTVGGPLYEALLLLHSAEVAGPGTNSAVRAAARSAVLATLSTVARRAGNWERAGEAAQEKLELDRARGDELGVVIAWGLLLNVHQARGDLDEVLRIRSQEQLPYYERVGDPRWRALTLGEIAAVHELRGNLDEALRIRQTLLPSFEAQGDLFNVAETLGGIADIHEIRDEFDEALRIRRQEQLPLLDRIGATRAHALALRKIAGVLDRRGDFDEAMRILRDEVLPVFEELGEEHLYAVTLGQIATILKDRGNFDEALRILREEHLPIYERLGDVRQIAVALDMIAAVLRDRGDTEEALRILSHGVLPVLERLGDERARAVILGRIAETLEAMGQLDEALRVRRDQELPIYERLGLRRELLGARRLLSSALLERGRSGDWAEASWLLEQALEDATQMRLPAADSIRSMLRNHGLPRSS